MQSACSTRQKFLLILFASVFSTLLLTTNSLPADFLCGNRELDDGEECDGEPCCQDCKFKPAGTVCRVNSWECDVPEYCTGAAAECPMDLTDMTKCLLHADSAATDADNVNPNMDTSDDSTYGGDSRFGYSPVNKERPLRIATSMSSSSPSTEFNPNPHQNHKYPKGTIFDFDNDVNGNNLEDIASMEFMCPVDDLNRVCSGNGKCIAENACLCYSGWVGTACSSIGDYSENIPILGSRRNATVFDEKEYFLGMIFLVFILVISLIGILATFSKAYITNQRNDFKRF